MGVALESQEDSVLAVQEVIRPVKKKVPDPPADAVVYSGALTPEQRQTIKAALEEWTMSGRYLILDQPITVSVLDWSGARRRIRRETRKRQKLKRRGRLHQARIQRWYRNVPVENRPFLLWSDIERVFGVGDVRPKMSWRQSIREKVKIRDLSPEEIRNWQAGKDDEMVNMRETPGGV